MRERWRGSVSIFHGVYAPIVHAGRKMAEPAPKLYLPARGLRDLALPFGLFDFELSAAVFMARA